jgi:aryl-alcohol dehydrogenase-like predicted oxidoreductase
LWVSAFGLGCARIGGIFKETTTESTALLSLALDAGITFFDTSDIYSQGESERLLGRAIRGRRERVVIATKGGYVLPSQRRFISRVKPVVRPLMRLLRVSRATVPASVRGELTQNFTPPYLAEAVESSLRRLGTDYIDLYQLHSPPASTAMRDDWLEALERLRDRGKIRYYGVSCDSSETAEAALTHSGVSAVQICLNLLEPGSSAIAERSRERGYAVIAREALANGLLARPLEQLDVRQYCRSDDEAERKRQHLRELRRAAETEGCTLASYALRWVNRLPGVSVTLVGASSSHQLKELLPTIGM